MDAGLVLGILAVVGPFVGGGTVALVKGAAREAGEKARDEAERRIKETLRGELALAFVAFKADLNGTYLRRELADSRIGNIETDLHRIEGKLDGRPCIARPEHRN